MEITPKQAKELVCEHHYSGKVVFNSRLHLGVFKPNEFFGEELVGVLQFGSPVRPNHTPQKMCSNSNNMLELNRMIMLPSEPRNSESKAISKAIKYIKNNYKDVDWLLSFSDGKENNVGYIYQATNWQYLGFSVKMSFYQINGKYIHAITAWHRYKEYDKTNRTLHAIMCENPELNYISMVICKQHVYVMPLKKHIKFNFPPKQYPKMELEMPILNRKVLKENGTVVLNPQWDKKLQKYEHQIE